MMHRTVADVMSTQLIVATSSTSYKQMVRRMRRHGVHALPIVDPDGRLVGIVTETDLAFKQAYHPAEHVPFLEGTQQRRKATATLAKDCMSQPVAVTSRDVPVPTAARLLHRKGVHHLPVVDAQGRLVGIVTRRDLLSSFLRPDEEIHRQIRIGVLGVILRVPEGEVDVRVDEGVVTLSGKVESRSFAQEIVARTRAVEGVVSVVDRLDYRHNDTSLMWPMRSRR